MNIIKLEQTTSTNAVLKDMLAQSFVKNGTVLVTDYQSQGRGQRQTPWHSEKGKNLMFSTVYRFEDLTPTNAPYLNYAVCWAVYEVLQAFAPEALFIKWPNDILAKDKKIAGILIENTLKKDKVIHSIIGIGVNVNQQNFPKQILATSLKNECNREINKEEVLEKIIICLREKITFIEQKLYETLKENYLKNLYKLKVKHTFFSPKKGLFTGVITDVNPQGLLEVLDEKKKVNTYGIKQIRFLHPTDSTTK